MTRHLPQKPKVLIAAPMKLATLEIEASQYIAKGLDGEADVELAAALPWQKLVANEGSRDASYRWVAREYHTLVVCLHPESGALGRGLYSMADAMLAAGKSVASWSYGKLRPVASVRAVKRNWKTEYGIVIY